MRPLVHWKDYRVRARHMFLANGELVWAHFDCGSKELLSPAFPQWNGQPGSRDRVVGIVGIG